MKKKLLCAMMVIALLATATTALATVPSKTTQDLVRVGQATAEDGTPLDSMFTIPLEPTAFASQQLTDIAAFVGAGESIVNYFAEDVKAQISTLLPVGVDPATLTMNEFVSLDLGDYQASYGSLTSSFSFATVFDITQTVIAMVGYTDATGTVVWAALPTTVMEDGSVQLTFPAELMPFLGHDVILSLLSVPPTVAP